MCGMGLSDITIGIDTGTEIDDRLIRRVGTESERERDFRMKNVRRFTGDKN